MKETTAAAEQEAEDVQAEESGTEPENLTEPEMTAEEAQAEIERLKAENAKAKRDLEKKSQQYDEVSRRAAKWRKQLNESQTEDQQKAEEREEAFQQAMAELEELRKEKAVLSVKNAVVTFIEDGTAAENIAEALYGAADAETAVALIRKAWNAKEKSLKLQFGKPSGPSAGYDEPPTVTKEQLQKMSLLEQSEFKRKNPDLYKRLRE